MGCQLVPSLVGVDSISGLALHNTIVFMVGLGLRAQTITKLGSQSCVGTLQKPCNDMTQHAMHHQWLLAETLADYMPHGPL